MKDIKYIIKRVIIGLILGIIFMFLSKYTVLAEELGSIQAINTYNTFGSIQVKIEGLAGAADFYETPLASNTLVNYGKGFLIFSFAYYSEKNIGASGSLYSSVIHSVAVKSGSAIYNCEIGNLEPYSDSAVQWKQASAKCYVNFGSNGLERLRFQTPYQPSNNTTYIIISRYATFVGASTPQSNQDIVNAISNQSQQQIRLQTETNAKLDTQIQQQQQQIQQQQQTNQKLDNIDNTLNDDSPADDNSLGALDTGNLPGSSGPLSSLMTLPITIIDIFLSNARGACNDLSIPIPFVNQNFTIPCISRLFSELGWSSYYETFGYLAGGLLMLKYLMYLYDRLSQLLYLEDHGMLGKVA